MEVGSSSYDQFKKKNTTWFSWLVALRLAMEVGSSSYDQLQKKNTTWFSWLSCDTVVIEQDIEFRQI